MVLFTLLTLDFPSRKSTIQESEWSLFWFRPFQKQAHSKELDELEELSLGKVSDALFFFPFLCSFGFFFLPELVNWQPLILPLKEK